MGVRVLRALAGGVGLALAIASSATSASAAPTYSGSYIFGDSLSDRGNVAEYLGYNFANPPSYHDSFTNGDVAVQIMAQRLGFNADPSLWLTGGTDAHGLSLTVGPNYAVGGTTANAAGGVAGANLPNQIAAYLYKTGGVADANALYTVFIGGNDVRAAAHQSDTTLVTTGVTTEIGGISALYNAGARNFLIVNVPDVGLIPEFTQDYAAQVTAAHADSIAYNGGLASGVSTLSSTYGAASFKLFDLYSFNNNLLANAAALGITDTGDRCYTGTNVTPNPATFTSATSPQCGGINPVTNQATNIDSFYYWDKIHPTAKVQAALGTALGDFVLGVPEPETWAMMIVGFGAIGLSLRSRRRVAVTAVA